jgi:hypothetical protein
MDLQFPKIRRRGFCTVLLNGLRAREEVLALRQRREKEIFPARIMVSSMGSPAGTGNRAVAALGLCWAQSGVE